MLQLSLFDFLFQVVVERQNPSAGEFQDLVKRERALTHKKICPRDGKEFGGNNWW